MLEAVLLPPYTSSLLDGAWGVEFILGSVHVGLLVDILTEPSWTHSLTQTFLGSRLSLLVMMCDRPDQSSCL
jgi:hypothetical protein